MNASENGGIFGRAIWRQIAQRISQKRAGISRS
jgi:hypothetical protein